MALSVPHWVVGEGSGEKSGGHRASCSPSHTVSGCLGGDQPPVFDHFSSKSGATQPRRRCRAPIPYTSAAARFKDSVEARGGLVSATTMRDGDTSSQNLNFAVPASFGVRTGGWWWDEPQPAAPRLCGERVASPCGHLQAVTCIRGVGKPWTACSGRYGGPVSGPGSCNGRHGSRFRRP